MVAYISAVALPVKAVKSTLIVSTFLFKKF